MTSVEGLESRRMFDAGQSDVTFGTGGSQVIDYDDIVQSHESAVATDVAQDVGGSTVIVGRNTAAEGEERKILVMRIRGDSIAHDATFGAQGGFTELPRRRIDNPAPQVSTDSRGRIYVRDGEYISRLTSRGKLDAAFGKRGKIVVSQLKTITDFLLDKNDNLYVYGSAFELDSTNGNTRIAVAKFDTAGAIEPTWGADGVIRLTPDVPREARSIRGNATHVRIIGGSMQFAGEVDWITPDGVPTHSIDIVRVVLAYPVLDDAYNGGSPIRFTQDNGDESSLTSKVVAMFPDGTTIIHRADLTGSDPEFVNSRISADGETIEEIANLVPPEIVGAEDIDALDNAVGQDDGKYLTRVGTHVYRINRNGTLDTAWDGEGAIDVTPTVASLEVGVDGELLTFAPTSLGDVALAKYWSSDAPVGSARIKEITTVQTEALRIPVLWRDDDGIDAFGTVSARDIFVEHPDGHRKSVQFQTTLADPLGIVAVYRLAHPDNTWDRSDNGVYTVFARPGEVRDTDGNANESRIIGRFRLAIP